MSFDNLWTLKLETATGSCNGESKYWRSAYSSVPIDMLFLYVYLIDLMVLNVQWQLFHAYLGREHTSDDLYYSDTDLAGFLTC